MIDADPAMPWGEDLPTDAWQAVKRNHAALIRPASAERFMLDRLCLDDDAPLRCEVERMQVHLDGSVKVFGVVESCCMIVLLR